MFWLNASEQVLWKNRTKTLCYDVCIDEMDSILLGTVLPHTGHSTELISE